MATVEYLHRRFILPLPIQKPGEGVGTICCKPMTLAELVDEDCVCFFEVVECLFHVFLADAAHVSERVKGVGKSANSKHSRRTNVPSQGNSLEAG